MSVQPRNRKGFTITELLVVIAVIGVLLGILLVALGGIWQTGQMTGSMNNLRQVATWMAEYSSEQPGQRAAGVFRLQRRRCAVPGQGAVERRSGDRRSVRGDVGGHSDDGIRRWRCIRRRTLSMADSDSLKNDYRYDSPDKALYDLLGEDGD
jgi:prepilin-type N-terminal cleavage/methylation domain-containing protein